MFSNRILKRISNRTLNKHIKIKLEFRIYKPFIFFHAINQRIYLIFNFLKIMKSGDTNKCYFIDEVDWWQGNYLYKS